MRLGTNALQALGEVLLNITFLPEQDTEDNGPEILRLFVNQC